jgi:division protein 1
VCVTGGDDGGIRIWDLERAEEMFYSGVVSGVGSGGTLPDVVGGVEEDVFGPIGTATGAGLVNGAASLSVEDDGMMRELPSTLAGSSSIRDGALPLGEQLEEERKKEQVAEGPCMRVLDGHTKAVTSLYFDGGNLVRPCPFLPSLPP